MMAMGLDATTQSRCQGTEAAWHEIQRNRWNGTSHNSRWIVCRYPSVTWLVDARTPTSLCCWVCASDTSDIDLRAQREFNCSFVSVLCGTSRFFRKVNLQPPRPFLRSCKNPTPVTTTLDDRASLS
jgi:hypothetical protein